jgi:hypothetical protein
MNVNRNIRNGDTVFVHHYPKGRKGIHSFKTAFDSFKITNAVEHEGFLEGFYETRPGTPDRIKPGDIIWKTIRTCAMNKDEGFYKGQDDNAVKKKKSKKHVFLSEVEYEVEEVLNTRKYNGKREFLIRYVNHPPSEDQWQQRIMLSDAVMEMGDAFIQQQEFLKIQKRKEATTTRKLAKQKLERNKRIQDEKKVKKERTDSN